MKDWPSTYYAVIFTAKRTNEGAADYSEMADRMVKLAAQQPGYLGIESVRDADGLGITVSYWESEAAIRNWKRQGEHAVAQRRGKEEWYEWFNLRVARVERSYTFP